MSQMEETKKLLEGYAEQVSQVSPASYAKVLNNFMVLYQRFGQELLDDLHGRSQDELVTALATWTILGILY